ncbi:MAG: hypothetical protein CMO80_14810 [Verrucomicrobiales bacterium]|nr:hypothetical protein [Verrucomicrobiales bacterium]
MVFQPNVSKLIEMRRWPQMFILFAISTSLIAAKPADAKTVDDKSEAGPMKQYGVFLERNPFNLQPPPKPPPPPIVEEEEEPPPDVKLTGISTLFNKKRVFLVSQPQGEPPKYLRLEEGERDAGVEVVSINPDEGTVKVKIDSKTTTLNFEDHGFKPAPVKPKPGSRPLGRPTLTRPGSRVQPSPQTRKPALKPSTSSRRIPAPPKKPAAQPRSFNFQRTPRTTSPRTSSIQGGGFRSSQPQAFAVPVQAVGGGTTRTIQLNNQVKQAQPKRVEVQGTPEERILVYLNQQDKESGVTRVTYQMGDKVWTADKVTPPFPVSVNEALGEK